jgi:GNAT superfamily N-acetyltransferase
VQVGTPYYPWGMPLFIRKAVPGDISEIECMVDDFVKGHPAENHPRSTEALRAAYFGERPVTQLLVAERNGELVGMVQWRLVHDMFWGFFGADAEWLYVKPEYRRSGIALALLARVAAEASKAGAQFLHGGGGEGPSKFYERVAIGQESRECHVSAKAFQVLAGLDGLPIREIARRLPDKNLGMEPPDP